MCGILGYVGKNIPRTLPLQNLQHRGPDANGVWSNNKNCILGHTRLSIRRACKEAFASPTGGSKCSTKYDKTSFIP